MNQEYKEYLVNQILAGITRISVDGKKFFIKAPTKLQKCVAYEVYQQAVSDCRYEGFLTKKAAKNFLNSAGTFTLEDAEDLEKWHKDIEECQFQLYTSRLNAQKCKFLRKTLVKLRKGISNLTGYKHSLDYVTIEGYADYVKTQYIIHCCLHNEDGSRVFTDNFSSEKDYKLIEKTMLELSKTSIGEKDLREIARTNPWRGYWTASKEQTFGVPSSDMTETQRALVLLTKMYDNAHENPEAPDEDVFEDDDLFDGWMLFVNRKRKKEKKEQEIDKMLPEKQRNAHELFIVTKQNDVQAVNDMNGIQARVTKKQRQKVIEQKGSARDSDFLDNKLKIQQQANRDFISHVKGK
tara:strand:+ start:101 stop:1153 length:1053 start_codon:yes stop_codon:yes gene_type:complete